MRFLRYPFKPLRMRLKNLIENWPCSITLIVIKEIVKLHEEQNMTSGVPILNKIPILQALFERKGNYTQNRKLLILLKALIVIPPEHEPTPAQMGQGWDMAGN